MIQHSIRVHDKENLLIREMVVTRYLSKTGEELDAFVVDIPELRNGLGFELS